MNANSDATWMKRHLARSSIEIRGQRFAKERLRYRNAADTA
jgi:hypothetical protein